MNDIYLDLEFEDAARRALRRLVANRRGESIAPPTYGTYGCFNWEFISKALNDYCDGRAFAKYTDTDIVSVAKSFVHDNWNNLVDQWLLKRGCDGEEMS